MTSSKPLNFDFSCSKKLILLSNYLLNHSLTQIIINDCVIPNITKYTCLRILLDYYSSLPENAVYLNLIQNCIEIASKNIYFLINNQNDEINMLNDEIIEEIIERYLELVSLKLNIDHSLIMRLMIKTRKLTDIFELLENERRKCISLFEKKMNENIEPTIVWKIKNDEPQKGFYKESDEFQHDNLNKIIINYYDSQKDVLNIALRISSVFSNDETVLSIDELSNSSIIFSILSVVEIPEINFKSNINFNCIFNNNKIKVLMCKIENFSKCFSVDSFKSLKSVDFSIKIYFNINYNFSAILTHICRNFYEYYSLNSLSKISKNVFSIILKNKILNIRSEDEILFAVTTYINNKSCNDGLLDLFKTIDWKKVSLEGLLEFILNESKLLNNSCFLKDILINEFNRRFKSQYHNNEGISNIILDMLKVNSPKQLKQVSSLPRKDFKQRPTQELFPFTSDLIQKLIKISSRHEGQSKQNLYSNNLTSTTNSTTNINSSLSNKNKKTSRNNLNNDEIKFPSSKYRINTSQESIDVNTCMSKLKIGSKLEDNLKCDGLSIDKSGYSTHRRLTSNLSFLNSDRLLFRNETMAKIEEKSGINSPQNNNNFTIVNCNIDLTKLKNDIVSPKSEKGSNIIQKKSNPPCVNYMKDTEFKKKFTSKLVDKIKNSTRTQSRNEISNPNTSNNHGFTKRIEKKETKSDIIKKDQQSVLQSRNASSKIKKGILRNMQLVFSNPEDNNISNVKSKNKGDLVANVKFKHNNFMSKLHALK